MTSASRKGCDGKVGEVATLVGHDVDEQQEDIIKKYKDLVHQEVEVVGYPRGPYHTSLLMT